jgi:hypothetical protein
MYCALGGLPTSRTLGDSRGLDDFSGKTLLYAARTPKANPKMDSIVQIMLIIDTKIAYRCNVDMVPLDLP